MSKGPDHSLDLIRKVRLLDLVSKKNAISLLDGHYLTEISGKGTEFKEARKYVMGESIRLIDWNMTARLGEPFVKVFQEERERNIYIALDISPSMYLGWQERTKIDYAVELAATLAYSAIKSGDRLGYLFFQDKVVAEAPAKRGKRQFYHFLNQMVRYKENPPSSGKTDIRAAIHSLQKKKGHRFVVFLISDFIDLDLPDDLRYLVASHDLALVHVYDPFEYTNYKYFRFLGNDPENPMHNAFVKKEIRSLVEQEAHLKEISSKYGLTWSSFSTNSDPSRMLRHFFESKKRISR
ncbi:hypothetical protein LPTSP4_21640 [Leptospira ryugenii]|uniref:DUF58 domain-containing protein n=1 Tax=Leptospira ryugenii TaxID=1917863 RepID=A0A2P2E174_9LEPT|nr:DUF58 domain-containing protein [Leptospira ryugenii]GBF50638.1 hypothetical protein LPTSP4_21640 [Leptospira ryugenii]